MARGSRCLWSLLFVAALVCALAHAAAASCTPSTCQGVVMFTYQPDGPATHSNCTVGAVRIDEQGSYPADWGQCRSAGSGVYVKKTCSASGFVRQYYADAACTGAMTSYQTDAVDTCSDSLGTGVLIRCDVNDTTAFTGPSTGASAPEVPDTEYGTECSSPTSCPSAAYLITYYGQDSTCATATGAASFYSAATVPGFLDTCYGILGYYNQQTSCTDGFLVTKTYQNDALCTGTPVSTSAQSTGCAKYDPQDGTDPYYQRITCGFTAPAGTASSITASGALVMLAVLALGLNF